jgi:hypothetical protein
VSFPLSPLALAIPRSFLVILFALFSQADIDPLMMENKLTQYPVIICDERPDSVTVDVMSHEDPDSQEDHLLLHNIGSSIASVTPQCRTEPAKTQLSGCSSAEIIDRNSSNSATEKESRPVGAVYHTAVNNNYDNYDNLDDYHGIPNDDNEPCPAPCQFGQNAASKSHLAPLTTT